MRYVVIIIAFLMALASVPAAAWADDDGGAYAGLSAQPTAYHAEAKGSDQAEGDEETEFC